MCWGTRTILNNQVYSFGHYNEGASAPFLKVKTTIASTPLLVSKDHMVYAVWIRGFVPASILEKERGDTLVDGSTAGEEEATIWSITTPVEAQGVFAPFTPSGKIVINNVVASSFMSLNACPRHSRSLLFPSFSGVPVNFDLY
jgi:hypothetical protein